ncbi:MAG: tetratricopeptide repeat protein, partial [Proteobacteria bacterium]|nr:tetratricopeptide repeat protein [Pseudomonadota bacterium]
MKNTRHWKKSLVEKMVNLDELEELLRSGKDEEAYKQIKGDRGITAEILINEGIFFGTLEDNSISISYFKLAEKIAEGDEIIERVRVNMAVSYNNRGNAYYELKKQEKAIEDYNKAIELNPEDAMAYNNRGAAYAKLKKQEKAIEAYNKAIELNPEDATAYNNRGTTYYELKKQEKAIEDYNKAIELNPGYAMAYNNRGNAYAKLKKQEKAIEDYNKAIELNPEDATAYNNRGTTYDELKKQEKAIEDYNKAIERNPEFATAYYNRGNAYAELKKYEKAIEDYNKAIELNPEYAMAYANRGITCLISNEDLYKAIDDFKCARDFFEGKDKEMMLGFKEWAEARNAMNLKNWVGFRERMNESKEYFDKINDPLSHSLDAFIKISYLDEELDQALSSYDPIEASEKIETALKNLPEVEGLIDPERTI